MLNENANSSETPGSSDSDTEFVSRKAVGAGTEFRFAVPVIVAGEWISPCLAKRGTDFERLAQIAQRHEYVFRHRYESVIA